MEVGKLGPSDYFGKCHDTDIASLPDASLFHHCHIMEQEQPLRLIENV